MNYIDNLKRALDFIEHNLSLELTIKDIASNAYISPYHFSRIFSAALGMPVQEYVIKRRLTNAAYQLINTEKEIISIAYSFTYKSQEAFTQSFKKMFKITPNKFRKKYNENPEKEPFKILEKFSIYLDKINLINKNGKIKIQPKKEYLEEIILVGLKRNTNILNNFVPEMWKNFLNNQNKIKNKINDKYYCLTEYLGEKNNILQVTAFVGAAVLKGNNAIHIPDGMHKKIIPASMYLIFSHTGKLFSEKEKQLFKSYNFIYRQLLQGSEFQLNYNFSFEFYDNRFKGIYNPDSIMDIYIPFK